jgi:hypothetical protein
LWKKAGEVLRRADEVFMVGYSLPEADSAALTLLLTSCVGRNVRVINPDPTVNFRLNHLFAQTFRRPAISFKQWLAEIPDCTG